MPKIRKRDRGALRREIRAEHNRERAEASRVSRRWLPWAAPLYWAGCVLGLAMLVGAAMGARGAMILGSASFAANMLAAFAIRKASHVAPQRFPMVYQSETGRVKGTTFCLIVALISGLIAWFGFESLYL